MAEKICEICGKEFNAKGRDKVCGDCRWHTKCCICGKEVVFKGNQLAEYKRRGWITCSNKCGQEKRRRDAGVTNIAQLYGNEKERECEVCGKPFMAKPNQTICPCCHTVRCCVCGKEIVLSGARFSRYRKQGWYTCSGECKSAKAKQTCRERYGVDNGSQTDGARAKIKARWDGMGDAEKSTSLKRMQDGAKNPSRVEKIVETQRKNAGGALKWERVRDYCEEHPHSYPDDVADALGMTLTAVYNIIEKHPEINALRRVRSIKEDVMAAFLDGLGVEYRRGDKTLIAPYELDFYIPDKNVAIEVNDFATHNVNGNPFNGVPKPKGYHWMKTRMCQEKGVRLIHAWEHCLPCWDGDSGNLGSWRVLQGVIRHALGLTEHRVYARNTKVVEFCSKDAKYFFSENNINGHRGAKTVYALVPKDVKEPSSSDIIMAYSVGAAHFGKGMYDAEITRGACRIGWNVVGGASKLWRHIIDHTDYGSIVYYVDRNYYNADSMGFLDGVEYAGHTDSFWNYWVKENRLANREPSRHAEVTDGYADGSVLQIFNAGTDTYVWRRK